MKWIIFKCPAPMLVSIALSVLFHSSATGAQTAKPNILVIFGDDIVIANVSAYSDDVMGYDTPHIDRIATEGLRFLHYYGEQSCTAGRSAFLTGQHIIRTGLSKVGFPGAPMGMSQEDPSIGGILKHGMQHVVLEEPDEEDDRLGES